MIEKSDPFSRFSGMLSSSVSVMTLDQCPVPTVAAAASASSAVTTPPLVECPHNATDLHSQKDSLPTNTNLPAVIVSLDTSAIPPAYQQENRQATKLIPQNKYNSVKSVETIKQSQIDSFVNKHHHQAVRESSVSSDIKLPIPVIPTLPSPFFPQLSYDHSILNYHHNKPQQQQQQQQQNQIPLFHNQIPVLQNQLDINQLNFLNQLVLLNFPLSNHQQKIDIHTQSSGQTLQQPLQQGVPSSQLLAQGVPGQFQNLQFPTSSSSSTFPGGGNALPQQIMLPTYSFPDIASLLSQVAAITATAGGQTNYLQSLLANQLIMPLNAGTSSEAFLMNPYASQTALQSYLMNQNVQNTYPLNSSSSSQLEQKSTQNTSQTNKSTTKMPPYTQPFSFDTPMNNNPQQQTEILPPSNQPQKQHSPTYRITIPMKPQTAQVKEISTSSRSQNSSRKKQKSPSDQPSKTSSSSSAADPSAAAVVTTTSAEAATTSKRKGLFDISFLDEPQLYKLACGKSNPQSQEYANQAKQEEQLSSLQVSGSVASPNEDKKNFSFENGIADQNSGENDEEQEEEDEYEGDEEIEDDDECDNIEEEEDDDDEEFIQSNRKRRVTASNLQDYKFRLSRPALISINTVSLSHTKREEQDREMLEQSPSTNSLVIASEDILQEVLTQLSPSECVDQLNLFVRRSSSSLDFENRFVHSLKAKQSKDKRNPNALYMTRFHNLTRLLMYNIIQLFSFETLVADLPLEVFLASELESICRTIKQHSRMTCNGQFKTDFYTHSHYNGLFLFLNKESISHIRRSQKDIEIHKQVYNLDITDPDPQRLQRCNFFKLLAHEVLVKCTSQENDHTNERSPQQGDDSRRIYFRRALQGITKLVKGNIVHRF